MKIKFFILFYFLFQVLVQAQFIAMPTNAPTIGSNPVFYYDQIELKNEPAIEQFIASKCAWLRSPVYELKLNSVLTSPLGKHYTYSQWFKQHEVFYNSIKVSVDNKGQLIVASFNVEPINESAFDGLTKDYGILIYYRQATAARKIDFINTKNGHIEAFLSPALDTIYQSDRKLYVGKDTMIRGNVFLPNPVQSAMVSYGSPYINAGNTDVPVLVTEQKSMFFKAYLENDTFKLKSKYLSFGEVSGPYTTPAWSKTPVFNFYRSHDFFEDVNSFYHLTSYTNYLEKMGFSNLLDNITIDAHAFYGDDNSAFDPSVIPYTLEYGTGGVNDAEDGQVVVHEFGHAMSQIASPSSVVGSERSAMEEGNADYFCVSYSRTFNDFNWDKVFTWDGHNEYWDGFVAKTNKKYPDNITNNSDKDREIWSSTLMCIYEKLGSQITDSLIMLHLPMQTTNTTMPQMARVLLKIDTLVWQAQHANAILNCFVERGILAFGASVNEEAKSPIQLLNSAGFASGQAPLVITQSGNNNYNLDVYDNLGQLVANITNQNEWKLNPIDFKSGVYYLVISNNVATYHFKIIKL
jgi:hypothetical protein